MIKPLGKRVLIKPKPKDETTKAGIILPTDALQSSFFVGEVISVNKEVTLVKKGDIVAHKKYGMEIIPSDDGDHYLVEESSLIGVYE